MTATKRASERVELRAQVRTLQEQLAAAEELAITVDRQLDEKHAKLVEVADKYRAARDRVAVLEAALHDVRINSWAGRTADGSIPEEDFDVFVSEHNAKIDAALGDAAPATPV